MTYSIITINYNNAVGLERTIQSVINQTYKSYEYIIIDGGSTDGSLDIIKKYASQIGYWVSEPDGGIYNAMNKGIIKASGNYLNFMNSGDCFYNNDVLETVERYLDKDIVTGKWIINNTICSNNANLTMMDFYNSTIQHQSSFINKNLFNEMKYDENLKIVSDWKFFLIQVVFKNCTFNSIDHIISYIDDTGISSTNISLMNEEKNAVLRELFPAKVLCDYERFHDKESPILDYIPILNKTYRLNKIVLSLIKLIIKLKRI